MLRLDRSRKAGPLLEWKVRLFVVGAGLGLSGIFLDESRLTGAAIVVLGAGGVMAVMAGRGTAPTGDDEEGDEAEDDDAAGDANPPPPPR